jgi:hypothetical protein
LKLENLELNIEAFKEMGGEYIFSAVEIKNYQENNLEFIKAFDHEDSAWRVFLYGTKDTSDQNENLALSKSS